MTWLCRKQHFVATSFHHQLVKSSREVVLIEVLPRGKMKNRSRLGRNICRLYGTQLKYLFHTQNLQSLTRRRLPHLCHSDCHGKARLVTSSLTVAAKENRTAADSIAARHRKEMCEQYQMPDGAVTTQPSGRNKQRWTTPGRPLVNGRHRDPTAIICNADIPRVLTRPSSSVYFPLVGFLISPFLFFFLSPCKALNAFLDLWNIFHLLSLSLLFLTHISCATYMPLLFLAFKKWN